MEEGVASLYALTNSSSNKMDGGILSAALLLEANQTLDMAERLRNSANGRESYANYSSQDYAVYAIFADVVANFALPTIIVLGIGANTTVCSLLRQRPRRDSIHVYLVYLSLVNGLILVSGSGYTWLCIVTGAQHLADVNGWLCRLWQFAYNGLLLYTPNWLLVAMLADQLALVHWPLLARDICTRFRAHCHVLTMLVGQAAVSIHSLWTYELQPQAGGCRLNVRQKDFLATVWPYISAVLCFYLPLLITCILLSFFCCCPASPVTCTTATTTVDDPLPPPPPVVVVVTPPLSQPSTPALSPAATTAAGCCTSDTVEVVQEADVIEAAAASVGLSAGMDDDFYCSPVIVRRASIVAIPFARPYRRQMLPVVMLGIVFTVLLAPGIAVNVVGHVRARWTAHPAWFPAILFCQLTSCLAYASAAFIFLIYDTSLRHQLVALCFRRGRGRVRRERCQSRGLSSTYPDTVITDAPEAANVSPTTTITTTSPRVSHVADKLPAT